jgi:hypothetical protein
MLAHAGKRPTCAGGRAMSDESKSDESKIGSVLANAPAIKKAFGPYLGTLIILVSVYFARPRLGVFRFFVLALIAFAAAIQGWFYY